MTSAARPRTRVMALDIGNVCISLEPDTCSRMLGFADLSDFLARCPEVNSLIGRLECGLLTNSEFYAAAAACLPGLAAEDVRTAWHGLLGREVPGTAGLVERARGAGVRVVFLSDICEDHHLVIRDRLSFSERVTEGVLSCRVGACKPDARMYEAFESRFCNGGVPCLYLDDRRDNVEAARQRGWPVHRFTGTEDAEQALVEAIRLLSGRDG